MSCQSQSTRHRLRVEEDSEEVVLVVCEGTKTTDATLLANEVAKSVAGKGKRRALIHVVSPLGRPEYFEVVRNVIQGNIGISMSIRYSGSSPEDLIKLINRSSNPHVVVAGQCSDFVRALSNAGYRHVRVLGGGDE